MVSEKHELFNAHQVLKLEWWRIIIGMVTYYHWDGDVLSLRWWRIIIGMVHIKMLYFYPPSNCNFAKLPDDQYL